LSNYRKLLNIEGKTEVELRMLRPDDKLRLLQLFKRIPENERFFLKEDVTAPEVVLSWVTNIDFHRVIPLVAVVDDEIIADATLHRSRSQARRCRGEIRIVVDPQYRRKGLALGMVRALVEIARELGLEHVFMETVEHPEWPAHQVALLTGFIPAARLKGWVCDQGGNHEDLVVLELPLTDLALWDRVIKTLPRLRD
jgi:GNAT superfamily N-acetyltransferase